MWQIMYFTPFLPLVFWHPSCMLRRRAFVGVLSSQNLSCLGFFFEVKHSLHEPVELSVVVVRLVRGLEGIAAPTRLPLWMWTKKTSIQRNQVSVDDKWTRLHSTHYKLINPTDLPKGQPLQSHAVQPNISQSHRPLFIILAEIPKCPK